VPIPGFLAKENTSGQAKRLILVMYLLTEGGLIEREGEREGGAANKIHSLCSPSIES